MRPLLGPASAAAEAVASGWVAEGPRVALERAFVEHVQAGYGVAGSSCTAALQLALVLHGVGPGNEVVVVPSLSFIATGNAVRDTGATPVFADAQVAGEEQVGFAEVLASGAFVGGPAVGAFAREDVALLGVRSCIGAGNGTDTIELALRACGIGAGDEVVLPANTFVAPAEAVMRAGAVPVLADVDKDCLLLDPESVASVVGPATRALMPVHLFGQSPPVERPADLAGEHGLLLIEDAAQPQDHHKWSNNPLYGAAR